MSQQIDQPNPLFVHVHIHKCAGTAFNDLIRRSFAPHHLDAYIRDPFPAHLPEHLEALERKWPAMKSIASHSIRLYPPRINNRTPLYVCFLREPVDWFVSYLTYVQANYDQLGPEHQTQLPPDASRLPLRDLAARMVERFTERPTVYCTFVRYLAETSFRHALSPLMELQSITEPLTGPAAALFDAKGPEMARRVLERFFFVGIVEQMQESVARLARKLAGVGLPLKTDSIGQHNVTRQRRDDLHWLQPSEPVGRAVRQWLRDDIALYQWAKDRFAAACD